MSRLPFLFISCLALLTAGVTLAAAPELINIDKTGVLRWVDGGGEVALFGANYSLPSGGDFRAAGKVGADRKKLVEQDFAHFARMGWNGVRLCFWGDWESSDRKGNLIANEHLDVLDYAVAEAHKRGISILFTPITTHSSAWPDAKDDALTGFAKYFPREQLCIDPEAVEAGCNYLRQILEHVNPYTGVALKDDSAILFIEMINEPVHNSADVAGTTAYLKAIAEAVQITGCRKPLFHNLSQDFGVLPAIKAAPIDGVTFAWYPTGLVNGRTLTGNHLRSVDSFTPMLREDLRPLPKLVYEFDASDTQTGYMYPAMARAFRQAGAQFAAMFTYDPVACAPYNLAWQTHHFNLIYTPRKAASAIIAAEAMRRLPLYQGYGDYPGNCRFGPFRVSYEEDVAEMLTDDTFLYSNDTASVPAAPAKLRRLVGCGSSPVVAYQGTGVYFLDRVADRKWRLEVYPDAAFVRDPFAQLGNEQTIVSRLVHNEWPMTVRLPDLGDRFTVAALNTGNTHRATAQEGRFPIRPGVYLLSADPNLDRATLPATVGGVGLGEFVCPPSPEQPPQVVRTSPQWLTTDQPFVFSADVITEGQPEEVMLALRSKGKGKKDVKVRTLPLGHVGGFSYRTELPAGTFEPGVIECVLAAKQGGRARRYPENIAETWRVEVVEPRSPLVLVRAGDGVRAAFTRVDGGLHGGVYKEVEATESEPASLQLSSPLAKGSWLDDYTISFEVKDRVRARNAGIERARSIKVTARGCRNGQAMHLTLVEADGTAWSAPIRLKEGWQNLSVPLDKLKVARGVMLPLGYPQRWNYWSTPAQGRGGAGDHLRLAQVERLQISFRQPGQLAPGGWDEWVNFASIALEF